MKLPSTMRYADVPAPAGPEVMQIAHGPLPVLMDDELLIRVLAAGVNRPDVHQRKGLYPPPPGASPILGLEAAGEVVAMGAMASGFYPGHKVTALCNGGAYAEYVAVPATQCLPWPAEFDAIQAAALPENYFTVWANVFQLAHAHGAKVFATAGNFAKCAAIERLGAKAINYREEDFAAVIAEATGG